MTTKFKVGCGDGRVLAATRYQAAGDSGNRLVVINSALGVRQSFYQALALYLQGVQLWELPHWPCLRVTEELRRA